MTTQQAIARYQSVIIDYLKQKSGQFVKIENIKIDLLVARTNKLDNFDRAYKELETCGIVDRIGNELRINSYSLWHVQRMPKKSEA